MKVGVIGIGSVGPIHINSLKLQNQEIVALCDLDETRCEKAKERFGLNSKVYKDYKQMLDECDLDVVHICTPHYLHAEMICEGLNRNINVLCEKPLAINEQQLDQIESAVKASKAQLGICFQNRFNASTKYIIEILQGKEIRSASFSIIWNRGADYYSKDAWRGTWDQEGGGVMINQAIHGLDLMQWICGMPESVIAYTSNIGLKNQIEVEDTAFGLFRLKNGGTLVVNATNAAAMSLPMCFTLKTDTDTIQLSEDSVVVNGELITKSDGLPFFGKVEWGVSHVNLIKNFYDCLEKGEKFSIDFYEAKNVIKLILAMYRSNGNEVKIQ